MLYLKHLSGQGKIKLSQGILKTYTSGNPGATMKYPFKIRCCDTSCWQCIKDKCNC